MAAAIGIALLAPPWLYVDSQPPSRAGFAWIWAPPGGSPCRIAPSSDDLSYVRDHPSASAKFEAHFACTPAAALGRPADIGWGPLAAEWLAILIIGTLLLLAGARTVGTKRATPTPDTRLATAGPIVVEEASTQVPLNWKEAVPPWLRIFAWFVLGTIAWNVVDSLSIAIASIDNQHPVQLRDRADQFVLILANIACIWLGLRVRKNYRNRADSMHRSAVVFVLGTPVIKLAGWGLLYWLEATDREGVVRFAVGIPLMVAFGWRVLLSSLWAAVWLPFLLAETRLRRPTASGAKHKATATDAEPPR